MSTTIPCPFLVLLMYAFLEKNDINGKTNGHGEGNYEKLPSSEHDTEPEENFQSSLKGGFHGSAHVSKSIL